MIEHLGLARLGLRDQGFIQDIKYILADLLKFILNLVTILTDSLNMLVGALGFFLLLNGRNDTPRCTSGTNDVLVGNREEIALIDAKFSTKLNTIHSQTLKPIYQSDRVRLQRHQAVRFITHLCYFL